MEASRNPAAPLPSAAPGDVLGAREALVDRIVTEIRHHGYCVLHADPHPHQALIDLRWAAQKAGRALDRSIHCYAGATGAVRTGKVTVIVAPSEARTPSEAQQGEHVRTLVRRLLAPPPGSGSPAIA